MLAGETEDAASVLQSNLNGKRLYSGRSVHHHISGWKTETTSVRNKGKKRKWDTKYGIQKTEEERNPEANFS